MANDLISDVKLFKVDNNSKVKANGTFTVAKAFRVKFALMSGPNGLFVGLPGEWYEDKKTKERKWSSKVDTTSKEITQQMNDAVLAAFNGNAPSEGNQGESREPSSQMTPKKNLPF